MSSSRPTFPPEPLIPLVGEIAELLQGRNESVSVAETVRFLGGFPSSNPYYLSLSLLVSFVALLHCSARQIGFLVSAGVGRVGAALRLSATGGQGKFQERRKEEERAVEMRNLLMQRRIRRPGASSQRHYSA